MRPEGIMIFGLWIPQVYIFVPGPTISFKHDLKIQFKSRPIHDLKQFCAPNVEWALHM